MDNAKYLELFQSHLAAYKHLGGGIGLNNKEIRAFIKTVNPAGPTWTEMASGKEKGHNSYLVIRFLCRSSQ